MSAPKKCARARVGPRPNCSLCNPTSALATSAVSGCSCTSSTTIVGGSLSKGACRRGLPQGQNSSARPETVSSLDVLLSIDPLPGRPSAKPGTSDACRAKGTAAAIAKVAGGGFEPPKAEPSRLQRDPFDRSGTPPGRSQNSDQACLGGSRRPGSTSKPAYLGPPSKTPLPPPTADAGMNHRRPSATSTNSRSQRSVLNSLLVPFQLWFPPRVHSITSQRWLW